MLSKKIAAGMLILASEAALAQLPAEQRSNAELAAELTELKKALAEQRALLEDLRRQVAEGRLASARGTGAAGAGAGAGTEQSQPQPNVPPPGAAPQPALAVGQPPKRDSKPPEVAPIFESPGVLTGRGKLVLEPAFQFGYSSSNRVALVGYTIIPALLIGLIDVREVKRNTSTATLSGRYGLSNRTELELRLPYIYRSDSTVSREVFTGSAVEKVFDVSGRAMGDIELSLRHQLNDGGAEKPYYVAGLRFKTRTGRDPFDVVTDCVRRCIGENATGTGLPLDLPTGSGFYALQPSLTWLYPTDPAVLFGSVSYLYNFQRKNLSRLVLDGEREPLGTVKPGAVIGFNFGVGLALNEKASLSFGYDHSSIARTRQNGIPAPGSVRTQLGTLLVGFSYRLNAKRTVNVSVGAGLTRDTPDVSVMLRIPTSM
ncbi:MULTISPECIES: acetate kinase [unclassified Duganella]|uniref:acetate kinase n=1 Tax=unclassified Duganella TaxID=2636909 RepID=UPI0006F7015F|nr:acetate kinase [Duganella sp. Root336D2]KRB87340.1 acetate kinase [Duganella sp. Root198D2]